MGYSANEMEYLNRLQKQKDMDTNSQMTIQQAALAQELQNKQALQSAQNEYGMNLAKMQGQNTKDIAQMRDQMMYKHYDMMYGNGGSSDRRAQAYADSRLGAAGLMAQGRMGAAQIGADGRLIQRGLPPMSGGGYLPAGTSGAQGDGAYDGMIAAIQQPQQRGTAVQLTGTSGQVGLSPGRMNRIAGDVSQASSYNPMLDPKMIQASGLSFNNPDEFAAYVSKYSNPPPSRSPGGLLDNTKSTNPTATPTAPPQLSQQQLVERGFQEYGKLKGLNYSGMTSAGSNGDSIAKFTMKDGKTPFYANMGAVLNTGGIQPALTAQGQPAVNSVPLPDADSAPDFSTGQNIQSPINASTPYTPTINEMVNRGLWSEAVPSSSAPAINQQDNYPGWLPSGLNSVPDAQRNLAILNGADADTLPRQPRQPSVFEKYSQYLNNRTGLGDYANTQAYLNAMPPSYSWNKRGW